MSPLGELIYAGFAPWTLGAILITEWWVVWFVLGRQFRTTSILVLLANGISASVLALLFTAGSFGAGEPVAAASNLALGLSCAALGFSLAGLEAAVLRRWMRRQRCSWDWNRYDFGVIVAVNFLGPSLAWWQIS